MLSAGIDYEIHINGNHCVTILGYGLELPVLANPIFIDLVCHRLTGWVKVYAAYLFYANTISRL
jgi:hypothetical protein